MDDENGVKAMADNVALEMHEAHVQAERLYSLQKEQSDTMMAEIRDHGVTLTALVTDVAVIKERVSELPELKRRVDVQERLESKKEGMSAAAVMLVSAAWAIIVFLVGKFWPK